MCAGAMIQARLPALVFAVDDPKAGASGSVMDLLDHPLLNHRVHVTRGVMAEQVHELLRQFFVKLRSGEIPRYSQVWKARQLVKKENPV
jgi:tRNA(adenine34) deaminase